MMTGNSAIFFMRVIVRVSKSFKRQAKPLMKKFHSLSFELTQLEKDLFENPRWFRVVEL
jgi:hypothetical protein